MGSTQYQQDVIRIEAHKLALKDDEFQRVSELVRREVRAHASYQQQRHSDLVLSDRDPRMIYISAGNGQQVATITFTAVRHQIEIKKTGGTLPISYSFAVEVSNDKPIIVGTKWVTEPLGVVSDDIIVRAVRHAIDALVE